MVGVDITSDVGEFVTNFMGVLGSQHVDLPSQSLSQVNRHTVYKTTRMSGKENFNVIIQEASLLAIIMSADKK